MASEDDYPTVSETRLITLPSAERSRIETALSEAESHVARMPPSHTTLRLQVALDRVRRSLDLWAASPPSQEHVRELRERVEETLRLAKTRSPTVRVRRLA
jgi:hypothetical protein